MSVTTFSESESHQTTHTIPCAHCGAEINISENYDFESKTYLCPMKKCGKRFTDQQAYNAALDREKKAHPDASIHMRWNIEHTRKD